MPFGYAEPPTHFSTSFDRAKYEVPGHRWADLSEHGFGVAVLTDSKYGYSCYGNELRISLLRSPTSPDPEADQGSHEFAYAVMPHAGGWRAAGELVLASDAAIAGGGPAATAAVTLARLGVATTFVGAVGADETGAFIRK